MEFKENPDYAYAVGVIRMKERDLLTPERFNRLAEAKDAADLLRLLSDTPYGGASHEEAHPEHLLQEALKREFLKSISLFTILCRDPLVKEMVFYRYDFHNLKVIFKEKVSKRRYEAARYPDGNYPFDVLETAIGENVWWDIQPDFRDVLRGCKERIDGDPAPHAIDNILERAMFGVLRTRAIEAVPFVRDWVISEIDLTNIGAFFRSRYAERPRTYMTSALIPGGLLEPGFFQKAWDEPVESLPGKFQHTPYRRIVERGMEVFEKGSFAPLDRAMMEYRLAFHREARNVSLGIEPLVSFLVFKEIETKVLRMILVGKKNRIDPEILKEFIPNVLG